jgi:hypothetical protein
MDSLFECSEIVTHIVAPRDVRSYSSPAPYIQEIHVGVLFQVVSNRSKPFQNVPYIRMKSS